MQHFAILGCGAWSLSIANVFNENNHQTTVWCHDKNLANQINQHHKLSHLPNVDIHPRIKATTLLTECIDNKVGIIIGVASPFINIIDQLPQNLNTQILILTKGFYQNKKSPFIFDYVQNQFPQSHISVLSGPNLAQEINEQKPAATVIASKNIKNANFFQKHLSNDYLRVYTSTDLTGVTLGGILKNSMAIAGGCIDGLNLGMNAKAAFLSRSLQEIIRIGCFLGGKKETFFGLSGLGDLITTANSSLSRNWKVGHALANGTDFSAQLNETGSVAEGIKTCKFMYELCQKNNIEAPITKELHAMLFHNKNPQQAIKDLMNRKLKEEL